MDKKPLELHLIDGTKPRHNPASLPVELRKRVPAAEWMDHPELWDKMKFVEETSEYLFKVYNIGSDQDKHTLSMLADYIDTYVKCTRGIEKNGIITTFNNGATPGPNPYIPVRNKAMGVILQLMGELGLTPRARLSANKVENSSPIARMLKGPMG